MPCCSDRHTERVQSEGQAPIYRLARPGHNRSPPVKRRHTPRLSSQRKYGRWIGPWVGEVVFGVVGMPQIDGSASAKRATAGRIIDFPPPSTRPTRAPRSNERDSVLLAIDGGHPVRTDSVPPWPHYAPDEIAVVSSVLQSG